MLVFTVTELSREDLLELVVLLPRYADEQRSRTSSISSEVSFASTTSILSGYSGSQNLSDESRPVQSAYVIFSSGSRCSIVVDSILSPVV